MINIIKLMLLFTVCFSSHQALAEAENKPPPRNYDWSATLGVGTSNFTPNKSDWYDRVAVIRHYFDRGSLALESLTVDRFNKQDQALAIDSYMDLWNRAYGNFRFQRATTPTLFPNHASRIEVFQGIFTGWEASFSYDDLHFSNDPVSIYSIGLGKYIGNFYIRARHLMVPRNNAKNHTEKALVRYYFLGDGDSYIEVNSSSGRNDDPLIIAKGQDTRNGYGVTLMHYPINTFGYKIGFVYSNQSNKEIERDLSAEMHYRW